MHAIPKSITIYFCVKNVIGHSHAAMRTISKIYAIEIKFIYYYQ